MKKTPGQVQEFHNALHLYPTIEAVAEHNVTKLRANGQHTGLNASKASPDDAAGLEPMICTAHGA